MQEVIAGAGKRSLVQVWESLVQNWYLLVHKDGRQCRTGRCFCREVATGAGVVVAAAVKWPPVQESKLLVPSQRVLDFLN